MKFILLKRREKWHKGKKYFHEQWVEPKSESGIVFYSSMRRSDGSKYYVVEGYGIGTIDPKTFNEIAGIAPIQRSEYTSLKTAKKGLAELKRENLKVINDPENDCVPD
jgi:hypothetical protein